MRAIRTLSFNKVLMIKDGSVAAMTIEIKDIQALAPIMKEKESLTVRIKRAKL